MKNRTAILAVLLMVLTGGATAAEMISVIEVERDTTLVDSMILLKRPVADTVATPGFGGGVGTVDTLALGDRDWPEQVTLFWYYMGRVQVPFVIDDVQRDQWYEFPVGRSFQVPRIKFVELGAIEEPSTRPVLARFDAAPNPFPRRTLLTLKLARPSRVEIELYDAIGTPVRTLAGADLEAGIHRFAWDGTDAEGRAVAGGIYLARLVAGDEASVRKLILTD